MISAVELFKEINKGVNGDASCIAVVPPPKEGDIKGASIDLHLGRWFCLLQQSRHPHFSFKEHINGADKFNNKEYFVDFGCDFVLHPGRF
ncbi:MAG: hypothetical protein P4L61_00175, partial [Candidatus Pacebacteria bacterium]|nr:hypothetical protein [Candidatus Paceibacterota bacterium]